MLPTALTLSGASIERDIAMLKFNQVKRIRLLTVVFCSVAVMAIVSAAPVAPAHAQSCACHGLLRLDDSPQPNNDGVRYIQRSSERSCVTSTPAPGRPTSTNKHCCADLYSRIIHYYGHSVLSGRGVAKCRSACELRIERLPASEGNRQNE